MYLHNVIPSLILLKKIPRTKRNNAFQVEQRTLYETRVENVFRHGKIKRVTFKEKNYISFIKRDIDARSALTVRDGLGRNRVVSEFDYWWKIFDEFRGRRRGSVGTRGERRSAGGRYTRKRGRGRRKGGIGRIINNESIVTRVAIPVDDGTSIPLLARTPLASSNNFRSRSNAYDYLLQY